MTLAIEEALYQFLDQRQSLASKNWVIGYSGGRDSHVLLHAAAKIRDSLAIPFKLKAIHVNHQLHSHASQWGQHCQSVARALNIDCQVISVNLDLKKGESLEAKAREARYQAIKAVLSPEDILLTAHTQDDQAETLLLQLMRGSGIQGLSCMGESKPIGASQHYRPLLSIKREQIEEASSLYGLSWITDDSNKNTRFDRNFIRHEILPILKNRFKGVVGSLAKSAEHCQEAASMIDGQAEADFQKIVGATIDEINSVALKGFAFERQKAVIRYWIAKNNQLYPSKSKLEDILRQINTASLDSTPSIAWGETLIRRYKQNWYLSSKKDLEPKKVDFKLEKVQGHGYKLELIDDFSEITIKYRQGGEKCKPAGQAFSKSLKKWFQIFEIPIWKRDRVPLVYYQDSLIGVLGYFICEGWQVVGGEEWGVEVVLKPF